MPDPLALRRGAEHLHALGPRAIAEFLRELADADALACKRRLKGGGA